MRDPDLLEKMNVLLSHGWEKRKSQWIDPITWSTFMDLQSAWKQHLKYMEKNK